MGSVDDCQFVVWQVEPDRMSKRYGIFACYGGGVDASMLELVDECLVVVGSHPSPAGITDLTIENVY